MAEPGCRPTSNEEELLRVALTLRIDWKLEKIIKRDGLLMTTSRGDRRRNPAAVDHRATATNLARTLNGIHLGDNTLLDR